MKYYKLIENTNDTLVIRSIHRLEKFSSIVINILTKKRIRR